MPCASSSSTSTADQTGKWTRNSGRNWSQAMHSTSRTGKRERKTVISRATETSKKSGCATRKCSPRAHFQHEDSGHRQCNSCSKLRQMHRKPPQISWNSGNSTNQSRNMYRSEEHTSELQSQFHLVCRLLLEKKKK